jgi:hypothetical protein
MATEIKNARVQKTMLGIEDHGILTAFLYLDFGHASQGFGGYSFDQREPKTERVIGSRFGAEFIRRVLEWERLPGTYCRTQGNHTHLEAIGHPLREVWYFPERHGKEIVDGL